MLVEVVLEPFVGKVDAKLFKAVVFIILEAEDVQDSDGQDLVKKTDRLMSADVEMCTEKVQCENDSLKDARDILLSSF